jgi:hypothetical protein
MPNRIKIPKFNKKPATRLPAVKIFTKPRETDEDGNILATLRKLGPTQMEAITFIATYGRAGKRGTMNALDRLVDLGLLVPYNSQYDYIKCDYELPINVYIIWKRYMGVRIWPKRQ